MSLPEHLELHGAAPFAQRRERRSAAGLIEQVRQAGLCGRGGAAFPTATKMRAVADARGRAIVVINACEGEPASLKDRTLLETLPHLALDGGALAAHAIGADEVILCLCESAGVALESAARAIKERRQLSGDPRIHLATVPSTYISGQESALVNHLNGGPAKPTFTPPMIFQRGVRRRPTLLQNAETLAHLALIARHGPQWFRQLGTATQPGSALVTLAGEVAQPGVYEIEYGAPLSSLIEAAEGLTEEPRAILVGGYAGSWIDARALGSIALCDEHLAPFGASLGPGVLLLLSERACAVAETVRVSRWLASQSAGQCGPCVHGLDAISTQIEQLALGRSEGQAHQHLAHLAGQVPRRGACGHPDGAVRFLSSALKVFAQEFQDHARRGPCPACHAAGRLPLPGSQRHALAMA
jgi:NADH:ubiquinone oxidoreductase subunit F (NADH-binding)